MTYASRAALESHEFTSRIKDSPDPFAPIDSCHLSASWAED